MSVAKNIEFHIQETWIIRFSAKDSAGVAIDLTGCQIFFRISKGTVALLTKDLVAGITITSLPLGTGYVTITPADQIAALIKKLTKYNYELKIITPTYVTIQSIGELNTLGSLFAV